MYLFEEFKPAMLRSPNCRFLGRLNTLSFFESREVTWSSWCFSETSKYLWTSNVHANSYRHRGTRFWYVAVFRNDFTFSGKPSDLVYKMRYILWVMALLQACDVTNNGCHPGRHLGLYQGLEIRLKQWEMVIFFIKDRCHGKARGLILTERENRSFWLADVSCVCHVKFLNHLMLVLLNLFTIPVRVKGGMSLRNDIIMRNLIYAAEWSKEIN